MRRLLNGDAIYLTDPHTYIEELHPSISKQQYHVILPVTKTIHTTVEMTMTMDNAAAAAHAIVFC